MIVFFNASVIMAGLISHQGASGAILTSVLKKKIIGKISETILDEILRHVKKIGLTTEDIQEYIIKRFLTINEAPSIVTVEKYNKIVLDRGDAHVLASSEELKAEYLVTLDKKHLLVLKNEIKKFKIVSPAELLDIIRKNSKRYTQKSFGV